VTPPTNERSKPIFVANIGPPIQQVYEEHIAPAARGVQASKDMMALIEAVEDAWNRETELRQLITELRERNNMTFREQIVARILLILARMLADDPVLREELKHLGTHVQVNGSKVAA
jgi:hypothetical protein